MKKLLHFKFIFKEQNFLIYIIYFNIYNVKFNHMYLNFSCVKKIIQNLKLNHFNYLKSYLIF